jgi:hypothetical protein
MRAWRGTGPKDPRHRRARRESVAPRALPSMLVAFTAIVAILAPPLGPAQAHAGITLLDYPLDLVYPTETVSVAWAESVRCHLAYGRAPGVYTEATTSEGVRSLSFTPAAEGMSSGTYYCIVRAIASGETSDEFALIVESTILPAPTVPPNGSVVLGTTTLLAWDPVDGVPYYHVVISDSEIELREQDGRIVVAGANVIWQAITSETSIQYGSRDPSGHFVATNGASPPLMDGFTYNWLVFNNYGNDPVLTSTAGAGLAGFTVDAPAVVASPELTAPPDSVTVGEDILDFEWEPVAGAAGYHLFIYEERTVDGTQGTYAVWDGAEAQPGAGVRLASFLASGRYYWRVIALDAAGRGAASEMRRFDYATDTGIARIETTTDTGAVLPRVMVEIEFAPGGIKVAPALTDENGVSERRLVPGSYVLRASKDGYVDTAVGLALAAGDSTVVRIAMGRPPARVRGLVQDDDGEPVFGAAVTARSDTDQGTTTTDQNGKFVLALSAGTWALFAEKPGYEPSPAATIVLAAGDYLELAAPLVLGGTAGEANGNVLTFDGGPALGAVVWADGPTGLCATATNATGHFSISLPPGLWTVWAEKSGFRPSAEREIMVASGEHVAIDPPIVLSPAPCALVGRVTDRIVDLVDAVVTAVPPSGAVLSTTTNRYGEFVLLPPPSTYILTAHAPGYGTSEPMEVSVANGESFTGIELEVHALNSTIEGTVMRGAEAVADAIVTDGESEAETSADGTFVFPTRAGIHDIRAIKNGCFSLPSLRVATARGQTLRRITPRLAEGASTISGRVRSGPSGVAAAIVAAHGPNGSVEVRSDDHGEYRLSVEAGEWSVMASKDGFAVSAARVVVVAPGQSAAGIDVLLEERWAAVHGSVMDGEGPVRRASILLFAEGGRDPAGRTCTDSDGGYLVRVAPERTHAMEVRAAGHGERRVSLPALSAGATYTANVSLPRFGAAVTGAVTDGDGSALEDVRVVASWGDSVSARTDRLGTYTLWLDDGLYDLRFALPGYRGALESDVQAVTGEVTRVDVALDPVFASLEGAVRSSVSGAPLPGVLVTAIGNRGAASGLSDDFGEYTLEAVVPESVTVLFDVHGFRPLEADLTLGESEARMLDAELLELVGVIGGRVTDFETGAGVSGVSVRAKLGGTVASTATTDAGGEYVLAGLDPDLVYDVYAMKDGTSPASENPRTDVPTRTLDADFALLACTGRITGHCVDATDGQPLPGATVRAESSTGFFGSTVSLSDGSFALDGLAAAGSYDVHATLYGYLPAIAPGVSPEDGDVTLALARNFARIRGTVTAGSPDIALETIDVVATNTAYGQGSRLTNPEEAGTYEIAEVRPGSYVLSVVGPGCVGTPAQMSLAVAEGATLDGLDFVVERATVARVEIGGPTSLEAGREITFSGDAMTADGRLVAADLDWWATPSRAGSIDRETGRFSCEPDYIGEVSIGARHPASGAAGRLGASVYATVGPSTSAALVDSAGMRLDIGAGALAETKSIHLAHEELPQVKRLTRDFEVRGLGYRLKPEGLAFSADALPDLTLPSPEAGAEIAVWDQDLLRWEPLGAESRAEGVEVTIGRLGEYATLTRSCALGVRDVRVAPNPFSPDVGPAVISYEVSSDRARMPFVTVRIFNMAAELVREIVANMPQEKGRTSVTWDGLTDDREAARNGRYVIEIEAEDPSGTKTALSTVVLVK